MRWNVQKKTITFLIFLEVALLLVLFSFFPKEVFAGWGTPNVTVITNLTVGNAYPEVFNTSIENNASNLALTPNAARTVYCWGVGVDYNGWDDIKNASAVFFDNMNSTYVTADDNNFHYTNSSCDIVQQGTYSDTINCSFQVWYYAYPSNWTCTINATDLGQKSGYGNDTITVSTLLGLGLPDVIYYGTVNATDVSDENVTNVTNYGNVKINLSLSGYGFKQFDNNSMNCTLGTIKNISIGLEKYNLTTSNPGVLNYTQFNTTYANLTFSPVVKTFNLNFRQNDTFNEAINATYWRVYVPLGVAGTCQGNIVFGATVAAGT